MWEFKYQEWEQASVENTCTVPAVKTGSTQMSTPRGTSLRFNGAAPLLGGQGHGVQNCPTGNQRCQNTSCLLLRMVRPAGGIDLTMESPDVSHSALAAIPSSLRTMLEELAGHAEDRGRCSLLISSNSLANRFILERWGIRPSQRKRYRSLYAAVRRHCRTLFEYYVARGRFEWKDGAGIHVWGVYKYDRVRGNMILGFVRIPDGTPLFLSRRRRQRA